MFYRIRGVKAPLSETGSDLILRAAKILRCRPEDLSGFRIYRRSLDCRKGQVRYVYTLDVFPAKGIRFRTTQDVLFIREEKEYRIPRFSPQKDPPVVVGFGPAGIFAALLLARAGLCPLVIERGKRVEDRIKDVERFFRTGELDPESNVPFGEGGAGTFSDGKLNTLLKDKNDRGRFVLSEFVKAGAPEEILFENKPHVGTDRLREVVKNLRREILSLGGTILFETRWTDLVSENGALTGIEIEREGKREFLPCKTLFLAPGHSARDSFRRLWERGVPMEKKIFSVGVRVEHPQKWLNEIQYSGNTDPLLPPADYKLVSATSFGKRLYTFCMCPGGMVVPAASEEGGVVTNGMSFSDRGLENSNSALLFSVSPEELPDGLFSGVEFQRELEKRAFLAGGGGYRAPAQLVGDFLNGRESREAGSVRPSYPLGVTFGDLSDVFNEKECGVLREGILGMDRLLRGFADPDAVLTGVESRSTSPLRILRGENHQSALRGLYPVGEGAGYAGGILSAAMDGMRAAEAYFETLKEKR